MTQFRIKATPGFTFWVFAKKCISARAVRLASVLTAISALAVGSVSAQSEIEIATAFSGGKLTELSGMKTTLSVQPFADEREVSDPRVIFTGELADGGLAMASRPLAEIVGEAMHSAFAASDARLAGDEAGMRLAGTLVATTAALVDRAGVESLQLTLRTSIQLVEGTRIVWQTNLFGRGTVPLSEGAAAALSKALDRLIEELLIDDYFLAEIR